MNRCLQRLEPQQTFDMTPTSRQKELRPWAEVEEGNGPQVKLPPHPAAPMQEGSVQGLGGGGRVQGLGRKGVSYRGF